MAVKYYKYVGESKVAFENGAIYQCEKEEVEGIGPMIAICDESEGWYLYSTDFFKSNFIECTD